MVLPCFKGSNGYVFWYSLSNWIAFSDEMANPRNRIGFPASHIVHISSITYKILKVIFTAIATKPIMDSDKQDIKAH